MNFEIKASEAISALNKGNLQLADIICRTLIDSGVRCSEVYEVLGHISRYVGRYDMALQYFQSAIDVNPSCQSAKKNITELRRMTGQERHDKNTGVSYLLIKAWGSGFWSDIDHILGQLLLAEITGRIPVVFWSNASLFSDGSNRNAYEIYFEPLSDISLDDLIKTDFTFFPPNWSAGNLYKDNLNKFSGEYTRMGGLYFLNRSENVLVSDYLTHVHDLRHWIPSWHDLYGKDSESIYRYLFKKYIKLNADIRAEIEDFREKKLAGKDCLAVHIRGSDKHVESKSLAGINASYHPIIEGYLRREPNLTIFLLTDYKPYLDEYSVRYKGRVVSTQCKRTDSCKGVHYRYQDSKVRNGIEVLKDACLASKCKYFIGTGRSNVSTSILHMKDWDRAHHILLGPNSLYEPHLFLHNW